VDEVAVTEDRPEPSGAAPPGELSEAHRLDRRFEILEAVVVAVAAVLTAWAAFQATKWSGVQADDYSRASAARTQSSQASVRAGQLSVIDVNTFTAWVAAIAAEQRAGQNSGLSPGGRYTPQPGTESAFLYERFRPEFKTAVDAWLAMSPLSNPRAAPTPFALPEYKVADADRAAQLEQQADGFATRAREANQRGDNYVLMTIVFASVLVLLGIGSKMDTFRARAFLFTTACVTLVTAVIVLFTFPIEF
jgi:uncharacterized MAPEG superfamily protein